jgi:electron-transferring-flavoprotein dehydrogenase
MTMPGAVLVGCDAGTINFAKIKGNHTAMKSGMLAAESIFDALLTGDEGGKDLSSFTEKYQNSWLYDELYKTRNFGPAMHKFGTFLGGVYNTVDQNFFGGKLPFNFKDDSLDHEQLKLAADVPVINYPKPDNKLSFDKLSSVFLSNTNHAEEQPCHLKLADSSIPIGVNLVKYGEPARLYCPAGVYEVESTTDGDKFVINSQNCVHCKTCDIKDPSQNITWVTPEGTGGPNYPNM